MITALFNRTGSDPTRHTNSLTRNFKHSVIERAVHEPVFTAALLEESINLLLQGEPEIARGVLRDLINLTVGFKVLAAKTHIPSINLRFMFSNKGNPSLRDFSTVIFALGKHIGVKVDVTATALYEP